MNCNGGMDRLETSRESPSFFNFFHIVYAIALIHSSTDTPLCCFQFESSIKKKKPKSICGKMLSEWLKVFDYLETTSSVRNARLYTSRKCSL